MGWAKYLEDNNEIIQGYMENRASKADSEFEIWSGDTNKVNEILRAKEYQASKRARICELLEIKESLSYKINLSLAAANSVTDVTVQFIAKSLSLVLEDAYVKVRKAIRSIDGHEDVDYSPEINIEEIKKNLVKNIFYKVEKIINNSEVISQGEMESVKADLLRLIYWFYNSEATTGKIGKEIADINMAKKFIREEMELDFCSCPVCGHDTIDGLKYCIECAREW